MKATKVSKSKKTTDKNKDVVKLPMGLLGFERVKHYALLHNPAESPFLWFKMLDEGKHAFVLLPPGEVVPNYDPDLCENDVEFLGLKNAADALVLNIVTLRGPGKNTVNLKGPIVINRRTLVGKQVIPKNAAKFPSQHPLPA